MSELIIFQEPLWILVNMKCIYVESYIHVYESFHIEHLEKVIFNV